MKKTNKKIKKRKGGTKKRKYNEPDYNENHTISSYKRKIIKPFINNKIYEYMDKLVDKDNNYILQDEKFQDSNLYDLEKIEELLNNKKKTYKENDMTVSSDNKKLDNNDIIVLKCFFLLQKLLYLQKVYRIDYHGQMNTIEAREEYTQRLEQTKTNIINNFKLLNITIKPEDIIFTNKTL